MTKSLHRAKLAKHDRLQNEVYSNPSLIDIYSDIINKEKEVEIYKGKRLYSKPDIVIETNDTLYLIEVKSSCSKQSLIKGRRQLSRAYKYLKYKERVEKPIKRVLVYYYKGDIVFERY